MNEKDVKLLFDAGHWEYAQVARSPDNDGWLVHLHPKNKHLPAQNLSLKRGCNRVFKTSDTAILWCKDIGFSQVVITMSNEPEKEQEMSTQASPNVFQSDTVLLVEDNSDDIALTLHAFKKHGIKSEVVVTTDGEEAVHYLFGEGKYSDRNVHEIPRLILLDLKLPKLNGLEVLKRIRENAITRFIPVVLLTTSDEHSDVIEGYKLGSNSYIKKPESYDVFESVVTNLTEYWLSFNTSAPNQTIQ